MFWVEYSYSVLAISWGSVRSSPPCLRGRASICPSASLTSHPTRAGINWSLMAFSSCSNVALTSGTVLWKWVHLEDKPLVNAEYAAWGSSCAYFESDWRSFTQLSTLFLMYCTLNDSVPITDPRRRSPWSVILIQSSFKIFVRLALDCCLLLGGLSLQV